MTISSAEQQLLFRRMWSNSTKRNFIEKMGPTMKIIGCVTGQVQLNDIGKIVALNQIVELNELQINKSNDLKQAIRMRWVEVIENRSAILRAPATISEKKEDMNKDEIMNLAREMAKAMAKEMMKDNNLVQELKNEISELKTAVNMQKVIVQTIPGQMTNIDRSSENIFVDVNESDSNMKANLKEVGVIKEDKEDLSDSLEKMKRFRRKPIKETE